MSIKLLASDLDGTIVSENNYISELNFDAITLMQNNKIDFAICTGKSYSISKNLCDKVNATYGIFCNGAQIYNLKTGDKIYTISFSYEDLKICFDIAKKFNLHIHAYSDDELISPHLEFLDLRNFKLQKSSGFKFVIVDDVLAYIQKNNLSIHQLVISSYSSLEQVKNEISNSSHVSISKISKTGKYKDKILNKEYEYLSVMPFNTNKNSAVEFLSKYLAINKSDILAIGDNLNDIDMVKNSGVGVAVANAYPELKNIAKYTTEKSAVDGGFAEAVFKFIPAEKKKNN